MTWGQRGERWRKREQGAFTGISAYVIPLWFGSHGLRFGSHGVQFGSRGSGIPETETFLGECDPSQCFQTTVLTA